MHASRHPPAAVPRPGPTHAGEGLPAPAQRLWRILKRRQVLHLDRYGLADLADLGLERRDVFQALYALIVTDRVQVRAARLGHVILCPAAPAPGAPALPVAARSGRSTRRRPAPVPARPRSVSRVRPRATRAGSPLTPPPA